MYVACRFLKKEEIPGVLAQGGVVQRVKKIGNGFSVANYAFVDSKAGKILAPDLCLGDSDPGALLVAKDRSTMVKAFSSNGAREANARGIGPLVLSAGIYSSLTASHLVHSLQYVYSPVYFGQTFLMGGLKNNKWVMPPENISTMANRNQLQDSGYYVLIAGQMAAGASASKCRKIGSYQITFNELAQKYL